MAFIYTCTRNTLQIVFKFATFIDTFVDQNKRPLGVSQFFWIQGLVIP